MLIHLKTRTKKHRVQLKLEGNPRMFAAGCVAMVFLATGASGALPHMGQAAIDIPAFISHLLG